MYIICTGKVSIWRKSGGDRLSLASISERESFGEMGHLVEEREVLGLQPWKKQ